MIYMIKINHLDTIDNDCKFIFNDVAILKIFFNIFKIILGTKLPQK